MVTTRVMPKKPKEEASIKDETKAHSSVNLRAVKR